MWHFIFLSIDCREGGENKLLFIILKLNFVYYINIAYNDFMSWTFGPGDIWSGSEGGVIKVWPWESAEKSLCLSPEERHMAALLVERSGIDLRSQVTVNGVCNISSSEVKCLLSDHVRAKVWAAGSLSFSLWYFS